MLGLGGGWDAVQWRQECFRIQALIGGGGSRLEKWRQRTEGRETLKTKYNRFYIKPLHLWEINIIIF